MKSFLIRMCTLQRKYFGLIFTCYIAKNLGGFYAHQCKANSNNESFKQNKTMDRSTDTASLYLCTSILLNQDTALALHPIRRNLVSNSCYAKIFQIWVWNRVKKLTRNVNRRFCINLASAIEQNVGYVV